ncbi:hypothetical protein MASR2M15_09130 [Anaerolineales bacterium]
MSKGIALIIEDTDANRDFFERLITQAGYEIRSAKTGKEALEAADAVDSLALAIIDMQMPDTNGIDLTFHLVKKFPNACLIIASMHDDRALMQKAFDTGCNVYMVKPHGLIELFQTLNSIGHEGLRSMGKTVIDQYGMRPYKTISFV